MFTVTVTTPEKIVYQDTATAVTIPTTTGVITVLPGHIPLMTQLATGELLITTTTAIMPLAITGGFAEIQQQQITLLVDSAEHVHEINEQEVLAAHQRAAELLSKTNRADNVAFTNLTTQLEKELTRLKIVRKHRSHHTTINQ